MVGGHGVRSAERVSVCHDRHEWAKAYPCLALVRKVQTVAMGSAFTLFHDHSSTQTIAGQTDGKLARPTQRGGDRIDSIHPEGVCIPVIEANIRQACNLQDHTRFEKVL